MTPPVGAPTAWLVEPARPADAPGLGALFRGADCPCHCRYFHFEGDKNAWLDRCANDVDANRLAFEDALVRGDDEATGVVARRPDGDRAVVGWAKVAPAAGLPKIYGQRLYKGLPCFARPVAGTFTIGCLLVARSARRQGVADALVAGAVELARARGAWAVEAFPRRPNAPVADEELWTGPVAAYARAGFVEVSDFAPYPVLRRTLRDPPTP